MSEVSRLLFNLPDVVFYSFLGDPSEAYRAAVEAIVARIAGDENIRGRSVTASAGGKYKAYRFEVFHEAIEEVDAIHREVGALLGTRMVL